MWICVCVYLKWWKIYLKKNFFLFPHRNQDNCVVIVVVVVIVKCNLNFQLHIHENLLSLCGILNARKKKFFFVFVNFQVGIQQKKRSATTTLHHYRNIFRSSLWHNNENKKQNKQITISLHLCENKKKIEDEDEDEMCKSDNKFSLTPLVVCVCVPHPSNIASPSTSKPN